MIALYARVSTRDKDQDPETQLLSLRRWAQSQGETYLEYVDMAPAGDFVGRTAWRDLLAGIRSGQITQVVVLRLDRAWRSIREMVTTLADWEACGVTFKMLAHDIDTRTPTGKLMLSIMGAFAEFEHDLISARVREGMARAKADGLHVGRRRGQKDGHKRRRGPNKRIGHFRTWVEQREKQTIS